MIDRQRSDRKGKFF